MIKKVGIKFYVYDSTGKRVLGRHRTRAEAERQIAAIEASKHAKKPS